MSDAILKAKLKRYWQIPWKSRRNRMIWSADSWIQLNNNSHELEAVLQDGK